MQTHTEVAFEEEQADQAEHPRIEDGTVDAEFVETRPIRRRPVGARPPVEQQEETRRPGPRISMALDDWLDVDRKLWELYNLVDIAIVQRDEERDKLRKVDNERDVLTSRLREWKTYARSLEKRLHAAQIENLELSHTLKRTHDVATEAVALSAFSRGRRQALRDRLSEISDDFEG